LAAAVSYEDGIVWCIDYAAARRLLPPSLSGMLARETCDVFTPELLAQAVKTLDEMRAVSATPSLVFLEPPALDQRIANQYALFSFLTHPTGK
jgi:hypothetical protein